MADAPHSKCGGKPCRFKSGHRHQSHKKPSLFPNWKRVLIVDKPSVCQRGLPGRLSSHCAAYGGPVFRRCALRVLAPPALRASNGQRPGRECIFTANASICSAKNARNDVHAVISDLSLVLPILCQCSEEPPRMEAAPVYAMGKTQLYILYHSLSTSVNSARPRCSSSAM